MTLPHNQNADQSEMFPTLKNKLSSIHWPRIRRTLALTGISLCVGSMIALIVWGFGFAVFPEYPDLPFQTVFILWILDLSRHVYLWIKGQIK